MLVEAVALAVVFIVMNRLDLDGIVPLIVRIGCCAGLIYILCKTAKL